MSIYRASCVTGMGNLLHVDTPNKQFIIDKELELSIKCHEHRWYIVITFLSKLNMHKNLFQKNIYHKNHPVDKLPKTSRNSLNVAPENCKCHLENYFE